MAGTHHHRPGMSGPEPTPFLDPKLQLILPKPVKTTKGNLREVTFNSGSSREGTKMPLTLPSLGEGFDNLVHGSGKFAAGEIEESSDTKMKTPKSIQRTVGKILEYIEDANAKRIGVYGQDGIGKTSALKVLVDHLDAKGMFDVVLWVTVSGVQSVIEIQDEIFKQLGLDREALETESNICSKFKQMKFLLILDDVWRETDLGKMSIPWLSTEKNCKLIMTAESDEVFTKMDALVRVEVLSFEEAWELFYEKVGSVIDLPDVKPYARGIVEQCRVLPLLIIGTGWALAEEKDTKVWACAFKEFQFQKKVGAQQLKFIYDRLKAYCAKFHRLQTCDIQGCFLYCALLSRGHEVRIPKLVEYWMQEGLIAGDVFDAVKNGHEIVEVLLAAALLEGDKDGLFIRMHNFVRDFVVEVLLNGAETHPTSVIPDFKFIQRNTDKSRPVDRYLLKAGGRSLGAPPAVEWEQAKAIFLMDNEFSSLPERPKCHNLSELFLQRNHHLTTIPSSFFDHMENLEVLNLSKTSINCIPTSISKLKNLRELKMKNCGQIVKLPSEVGKVRLLEVLDLDGTKIEQLPVKTGELATLRCMRVCFHDVMSSKSPTTLLSHGFLRRLLPLRSLSIVVVPGDRRWNNLVEDIVRDMRKLRNLAELHFYFPEVRLLQHFLETCPSWKRNVLKKFNFVVGHDVKRMMSRVPYDVEVEYNKRDRCLRFVNSDSETVPDVLSQLLPYATAFYLDHDVKIQSLSDFGNENIAHLEFCVVRECPKVESIMNGEGLAFPLLEQLSVHYAKRLKCIWSGNLQIGSFASLKHLCLRVCGSLQYVMTRSMSQYVSNLEELVVEACAMMTELVKEDKESLVGDCEFRPELEKKDEDKIVMCGHTVFPRLKCLTLHYLPKLFSIWEGPWPALQNISFYNCPNLRNLHMGHNSEIRRSIAEIKAENEWWSKLVWEDASLYQELEACFVPFGEEYPSIVFS